MLEIALTEETFGFMLPATPEGLPPGRALKLRPALEAVFAQARAMARDPEERFHDEAEFDSARGAEVILQNHGGAPIFIGLKPDGGFGGGLMLKPGDALKLRLTGAYRETLHPAYVPPGRRDLGDDR